MKNLIKKFFGISETPDYRYGFYNHPRKRENYRCGWEILKSAVWSIGVSIAFITTAMFVLKIIGLFNHGWIVVFSPVICEVILRLISYLIDNKIIKIQTKIEEEALKEEEKRFSELCSSEV